MSGLTGYETTAEQRIDELRHSGVRLAIEQLVGGRADLALTTMLSSVEQQWRIAGIR